MVTENTKPRFIALVNGCLVLREVHEEPGNTFLRPALSLLPLKARKPLTNLELSSEVVRLLHGRAGASWHTTV